MPEVFYMVVIAQLVLLDYERGNEIHGRGDADPGPQNALPGALLLAPTSFLDGFHKVSKIRRHSNLPKKCTSNHILEDF